MAPFSSGIVFLGYAAAYHRLSNNPAEMDKAIAAIEDLADAKPNKVNYCGEALLINGRYQRAIDVFETMGTSSQSFDRTVQTSGQQMLGRDEILDRLEGHLSTLRSILERNRGDFEVIKSRRTLALTRAELADGLRARRRRAAVLIEELGLRTRKIMPVF